MTSICAQLDRQQSNERGSIIIMTAIFMLLLFLMLGLCIDVSRIYMVRAELQNAADAASLSAARELDSYAGGIDKAFARATNIVNTQGFGKIGVTIASVEFAANPDGPDWFNVTDAKDASRVKTIRYVRTTTQTTSTAILFGLAALGSAHLESRSAVAGQSVGINGVCDYFNIALAVDPATNPTYSWATGTELTAHFHDNLATTITLTNMQYMVLDTSWHGGTGLNEFREALAGVNPRCIKVGDIVNFDKSTSANNPRGLADGTNTRFDLYSNGLKCSDVNPDQNVRNGITLIEYSNSTSTTAPSNCPSGEPERRLVLIPVIDPIPNAENPTGDTKGRIKQLRGFFLKQSVSGDCGQPGKPACPGNAPTPGDIVLEYAGDDFVVGRGIFDPTACSNNIGIAVLYR
jgi:Flp pilus assembly protein TadG